MLAVVPEHPVNENNSSRLPIREVLSTFGPTSLIANWSSFSILDDRSAMTNSLSFFFCETCTAGWRFIWLLSGALLYLIVAIPLWFKLSAKVAKHRATMVAISGTRYGRALFL